MKTKKKIKQKIQRQWQQPREKKKQRKMLLNNRDTHREIESSKTLKN